MKRIALLLWSAILLCSCIDEMASEEPQSWLSQSGEPVTVNFSFNQEDSTATRSSFSASETEMRDINLFVYHEGKLLNHLFSQTPETLSLTLVKGHAYNFYAVANMGELEAFPKEETLLSLEIIAKSGGILTSVFPISWQQKGLVIDEENTTINIVFQRIYSRIRFSLDKSALENFQVTGVKLRQVALNVYVFETSKASSTSNVGDGDYASESDLTALNSGKEITLYAMENCQGTLLSNNTDSDNKNPDHLGLTQSKLCTYLEMTGSFKGEYEGVTVSSENVKYRFYLGEDNCSNFDLRRNQDIVINLTLSEERIFDESWKVDYGATLPKVTYALETSASSLQMKAGTSEKVILKHIALTDGTRYSETDVTDYAEWSSSNTSVATVEDGEIKAISGGSATITATFNGIKTQIHVSVSNVTTYELRIDLESTEVEIGSSLSATGYYVTYTNGVETDARNINYSASWSTSSSSVATVSYGKITGKAAGTATITMKYNNITETVTVKVLEKPTYELLISPETISVIDDKKAQATAIYKTLRGSEIVNVEDVTSKASWSTASSSIAYVNSSGQITAVSEGSTTITAKYNSMTATCTVTVTPRQVYELALSESSMQLNKAESKAVDAYYNYYLDGELKTSSKIGSLASWSSSNTSVATVSSTGIIKGVAAGTATITVTYQGLTATVTVTVVGASSLALEWTSATIIKGDQKSNAALYTITSSGSTSDVTSSATWKSSNTSVAYVSKGVITARGAGTATITATYSGLSVTCTVTVTTSAQAPYVLMMSATSSYISDSMYEVVMEITMSDHTVIKNVPYTWKVTYSQNSSIAVGMTGTGPIQYRGDGISYISIFDLETTDEYLDSSGNTAKLTRSFSVAHNMGWTP